MIRILDLNRKHALVCCRLESTICPRSGCGLSSEHTKSELKILGFWITNLFTAVPGVFVCEMHSDKRGG